MYQIIDQLERKLMRLDIEANMLQKEDDPESRSRLDDVKAALAQTREEATTFKVRLQVNDANTKICTPLSYIKICTSHL